jgi:hypothetical protein
MAKAKHDPLLAALIAKLPADAGRWPRTERVAWLQMLAMAFDVVYGPCDGIRVAPDAEHGHGRDVNDDGGASAPLPGSAEQPSARPAPAAAQRFYVDRDGFAMGDGRPITMADLPAGAVLWDERVGIESGDVSAILWRDVGTSRERLPPGVTLRPVFDES